MATLKIHGQNFLSWKGQTPVVIVSAESEDFDDYTLTAWRGEGFEVRYVPLGDNGSGYVKTLQSLGDSIGVGGSYAIVGTLSTSAIQHRDSRGFPQHSVMLHPSALKHLPVVLPSSPL